MLDLLGCRGRRFFSVVFDELAIVNITTWDRCALAGISFKAFMQSGRTLRCQDTAHTFLGNNSLPS